MTTKSAIKTLGLKYSEQSIRQVQRWARNGTIKAVKNPLGWDYDGQSLLALREQLQAKPASYYTSREIAEMLHSGLHTPERLVKSGKLTAWRTPGSPRGKWKFPKMKVLGEIEVILKSKKV